MQNDAKDRHVLAAAVASGAKVIITPNLRDFPKEVLAPLNIEAQSPDEFLLYQFESDRDLVIQAIEQQSKDLKNPPYTFQDVLKALALHVPNFVRAIEEDLKSKDVF